MLVGGTCYSLRCSSCHKAAVFLSAPLKRNPSTAVSVTSCRVVLVSGLGIQNYCSNVDVSRKMKLKAYFSFSLDPLKSHMKEGSEFCYLSVC